MERIASPAPVSVLVPLVSFFILCFSFFEAPSAQPQPRDARGPQAKGTAVIRGRVVVAGGDTPIARIAVTAVPTQVMASPARQGAPEFFTATTDDTGAFEIRGLPAGRYMLAARVPRERAQYVSSWVYGASAAMSRGRTLEVADGAVLDKILIPVPRAAVIAGRVIDEHGDPIAWVRVSALLLRPGATEPVNTGPGVPATDDHGRFRLFGLAPGEYYVKVEPESIGHFGPAAEKDPLRYVAAFYPGVLTHEEAQRITLESGQEVPDIEITLRRSRTYKVSGVVTSAHGGGARLGRVHVSYSRDRHGWSGGMVNPDGTFVLTGLVPGQYEVFATTMFGMGDSDAIPEATSPVTIQVDGDVEGVTLVMRRAASVTGRVIIDSESPVATDGVRVQAMPPPSGGYRTLGPPSEASVNDDGSFTLKRMLGQLLLRAHAPGRLRLRSVTYKGVDVTDVPTEFADSTDPKDLQIVVTDRGAQITGRVTDEKGDPVKESEIILFAADQKRWAWWARTTERMMLDGTGTFSFKMLRPDRYLLVALGPQSLVPIGPGPNDAPMFEKLASVAMPVEVIENEVREITLTQAKLPR